PALSRNCDARRALSQVASPCSAPPAFVERLGPTWVGTGPPLVSRAGGILMPNGVRMSVNVKRPASGQAFVPRFVRRQAQAKRVGSIWPSSVALAMVFALVVGCTPAAPVVAPTSGTSTTPAAVPTDQVAVALNVAPVSLEPTTGVVGWNLVQ